MPKKIKSVKKLRSSKPTLSGMTKEELESILLQEQQKEREPKIALHNAQLEIKALKEKLRHPTFHDLGKPHDFDIPLTDRLNIDNLHHEQLLTRVEQAEIGNIFTFFIGITMTIFFLTTTLLLTFWP